MKEWRLASNILYNSDAENFVLAGVLRNPDEVYSIYGDATLESSDFIGTETKRIARAIDECVAERRSPTLPYIIEHLRLDGNDDTIEYVSRLNSLPCSVSDASEYAGTVKGLSISRRLANAGARIIEIAREQRSDYSTAVSSAESVLRNITQMLPTPERSPEPGDIIRRMKANGPVQTIPLYFSPTLQAVTGGIHSGEFWVIGGFSSTGKSAFAANLILDILRSRDKRVALFNVEMSQETYMTRLVSIKSGVPQKSIRDRVSIGLEQHQALDASMRELERAPLLIYDTIGTISGIRSEAKKIKEQKGLDVIIIDYIQSIRGHANDEVKDAREVAIECQSIAKDLQCSVIAFSQVSNAFAQQDNAEGGAGNFYSFKGHGAIRDNADVALMLRRDRKRQSPALNVSIEKNRHGELAQFICHMTLQTGAIEEMILSEEEYEDE
jgi:replicative DNA helicase